MDALQTAVENLEVAVDDYTQATYAQFGITAPTGTGLSAHLQSKLYSLRSAVVTAATEVALAMVDADVEGAESSSIIPEELRFAAAEAEIAALHGNAKLVKKARCARCAGTGRFITYVENGVPKGPGGPCYRCNGKGVQTVEDHRRNYGHDNYAPIAW
jgi:hypothetical protein